MGSWLEDGSWGLGVFAPDTSKFRVYTYTLTPVYCAAHVLLSALCIYTNHAHAACCTANVRTYLVYSLQVPKGELSTYCPMPVLISTKGYGLQMDTYYRSVLQALYH